MAELKTALRGCGFLLDDAAPADVMTPEDFTEDQRALRSSIQEFLAREVLPKSDLIEMRDHYTLRLLMEKAGSDGFLGVEVPEAYGGFGQDIVSSAVVCEALGAAGQASYTATFVVQTGIGMLPILYFGTEDQRKRYLPDLVSGKKIAAYALTEAGSGSDALSGKTSAVLNAEGTHWVVNGTKQFITNGGIADVYIVYVKIGGKDACLIVDRSAPGFKIGKEEHKLGIVGSSTCSLAFTDALVPKENLLGEIGRGKKIMMNTMNLGRFKLAAVCVGVMKTATTLAVKYAMEREQFGKPIMKFDAIRQKIGEMIWLTWVGESMVYRTAGLIAKNIHGVAPGDAAAKAIEEYSLECALVKVALSEMLWRVVNHAMQIYGGNGYIEEYPIARMLRDSRINMIFEGTNEINRLHMMETLLKRGSSGALDLMGAFGRLVLPPQGDNELIMFDQAVECCKNGTLFTSGETVMKHLTALRDPDKQQFLLELADMIIGTYGIESVMLRNKKLPISYLNPETARAAATVACSEVMHKLRRSGELVLSSLYAHQSEERTKVLKKLGAYLLYSDVDVISLRHRLAGVAEAAGKYPL